MRYVNDIEKKKNNEKLVLNTIVTKLKEIYEDMKKYRDTQDFNSSKSFYEFINVDDSDQFAKETGCNTMIKLNKSQISSKIKGEFDLPLWELNRRSKVLNRK